MRKGKTLARSCKASLWLLGSPSYSFLNVWHILGLHPFYFLPPTVVRMSIFSQRPHYRLRLKTVRENTDYTWKENELADLCSIQRCQFHGRDRCHVQDFEAGLCLRTHSSHGAASCVCFSGPAGDFSKIPHPHVWPSLSANFCITRFLSPRHCCRA